jgi:mannose-6-phosphate isomerase
VIVSTNNTFFLSLSLKLANMVEKVIQLKCNCNTYGWGRTGRESLAATLCEKTPGTDFKLDEKSPYAEM